jgi:hypothetical protein
MEETTLNTYSVDNHEVKTNLSECVHKIQGSEYSLCERSDLDSTKS